MLVKPVFKQLDPTMSLILGTIGKGYSGSTEIETGMYEISHFSMGKLIGGIKEEYPEFKDEEKWLGAYGICDSVEQVKKTYKRYLKDPDKNYCIGFTKIIKSEEPSEGGWRWHKWGEYIGTKNPQCEYIYDEGASIKEVYVYHIFKMI